MSTMLDRVLLGAMLCITVHTASADPVILYGPYQGSETNRAGFGLACIDRASPSSTGSDFLMGFPSAPNLEGVAGKAQIMSGANGTTILLEQSRNSGYGFSGSSIGDINGDGGEEVIIGDPDNEFAFIESLSLPSLTISGTSAGMTSGSRFGYSVAGLLDAISGSARNTVVVGAPSQGFTNESSNDGAIAFFDSNDGSFFNRCDAPLGSGGEFGTALASIQDLNADGVRDIIASSPMRAEGNGRVDVISADSGEACTVIRSVNGSRGAQLGRSVAAVGDQNGDGVEDFLAGGPRYTDTADDQGSAVLVSGATGTLLCLILGSEASELLGTSVAGIGDANYDGRPDFAIGVPGKNSGSGQIVGYTFDQTTATCPIIFTLNGAPTENLGKNLAGTTRQAQLCDMNRDGYPEFIAGTGSDTNGVDSGSTIVYSIPTPTPTSTPTSTPTLTPTSMPTSIPTSTRTPRPTRTPTVDLPDRSRLTFRISENGSFVAINSLNRDPHSSCTVRLQARYSRSDLTGASTTRVLIKSKRARQSTKFEARGLPITELDPTSSKPYILHIIARNYCGKKTFASNVASRYLTCGVKPKVSVETFVSTLTQAIR